MSHALSEGTSSGLDVRGGDPNLPAKCASDSQVVLNQQMMPADANPFGNVHGGYVMKLVDEAGALAAMRHARRPVVTIAMDSMTFLSPVKVGHLVTLHAAVNWVGRSSIEAGVRVIAENPITGETVHTNSAFAVYVALDDDGKPASAPPLILETEQDRRRWAEGQARQELRLKRAKRQT